jgi:hypothetical protein
MNQVLGQGVLDASIEDLKRAWAQAPHPSVKITSYFPAYAELFNHLRGTRCTFIETGILDGGSLFMWREWLGSDARIIGIDLNPAAEQWRAHGFEIFIGDQGDPKFWRNTFASIGPFDALLDDGGHQSFQQIVTAAEAIDAAKRRCVIVVEDTATSFMKDFSRHGRRSFLEYAKDCTDVLIGRSAPLYPDRFPASLNNRVIERFRSVYAMRFYNGIVSFHLNPSYSYTPEVVRNRPPNAASDFRYEGRSSASVDWPHPFRARIVHVSGGPTRLVALRMRIASALPTPFKARLKQILKARPAVKRP